MQYRILCYSFIGFSTKQNTYCRIIVFPLNKVVVHTNIHIQLSYILMSQRVCLEFKQNKTLNTEVIEDKVDIIVTSFGLYMLLTVNKSEASSKF